MRHRRSNTAFNRTANQRKALFRGLIASLIEHERIETTVAKAKEIKKLAERMVTLGKKGTLHSRRLAFSCVPSKKAVKKLFDEIGPRFSDRNGGYLRLIKTRTRIKDNAPLAVLEFIDYEDRNFPESKGATSVKKETLPKKEPPVKKEVSEKKEEAAEKATSVAKKDSGKKKTAAKKKVAAKKKSTKKTAAKKKTSAKKKTTKKKKTSSKKRTSK